MCKMNLLYCLNCFHRVGRIKVECSWLVFKQLHRFWTILCTITAQQTRTQLETLIHCHLAQCIKMQPSLISSNLLTTSCSHKILGQSLKQFKSYHVDKHTHKPTKITHLAYATAVPVVSIHCVHRSPYKNK